MVVVDVVVVGAAVVGGWVVVVRLVVVGLAVVGAAVVVVRSVVAGLAVVELAFVVGAAVAAVVCSVFNVDVGAVVVVLVSSAPPFTPSVSTSVSASGSVSS